MERKYRIMWGIVYLLGGLYSVISVFLRGGYWLVGMMGFILIGVGIKEIIKGVRKTNP